MTSLAVSVCAHRLSTKFSRPFLKPNSPNCGSHSGLAHNAHDAQSVVESSGTERLAEKSNTRETALLVALLLYC